VKNKPQLDLVNWGMWAMDEFCNLLKYSIFLFKT